VKNKIDVDRLCHGKSADIENYRENKINRTSLNMKTGLVESSGKRLLLAGNRTEYARYTPADCW